MNRHKLVIDVLLRTDIDWKAIVVDIAKKHPKAVLDALPPTQVALSLDDEVRALLRANLIVGAIKLVRNRLSLPLKEAKDYVDALHKDLGPC